MMNMSSVAVTMAVSSSGTREAANWKVYGSETVRKWHPTHLRDNMGKQHLQSCQCHAMPPILTRHRRVGNR